jgi:hypothetical protein
MDIRSQSSRDFSFFLAGEGQKYNQEEHQGREIQPVFQEDFRHDLRLDHVQDDSQNHHNGQVAQQADDESQGSPPDMIIVTRNGIGIACFLRPRAEFSSTTGGQTDWQPEYLLFFLPGDDKDDDRDGNHSHRDDQTDNDRKS